MMSDNLNLYKLTISNSYLLCINDENARLLFAIKAVEPNVEPRTYAGVGDQPEAAALRYWEYLQQFTVFENGAWSIRALNSDLSFSGYVHESGDPLIQRFENELARLAKNSG